MTQALSSNPLVQWLSIASLVAVGLTACGGDDDDGAASGGSGGKAGASGKGGGAGKGAASGQGGSAASAGAAGKAGRSGSGGTAGSGTAGRRGTGTGATAGDGGATGAEGGASGAAGADEGGEAGSAAGATGSAGASGEGGAGGAGENLPISTPAQLSDESQADYADNLHGLVTGGTVAHWVENWSQNRPLAATGKLVVLQISPNVANSLLHVAANDGVVSYLVPNSELTQVRDNGLSQIEAEIPDGAAADAWLRKYGIDAGKDYVVLTFEQLSGTQNSIVQSVGRAWLLLRYWGFPKERLGILNGSVNWNATHQGLVTTTAAATTPPNDGTASVRDLRVDNTAYVVTLSSLLAILKQDSGATPLANVSIVDARGGAEALGLQRATSTGKSDCANYTTTNKCSPPFEGRLKGANSVPWPQFLDTSENGFRFFPKASVKSSFDTQAEYTAGQLTIQYCRTNMRSMVTGLVANVILGYPTRFYDTSFIEWSHLSYGPTALTRVLPDTSPFRTDLAALTEHADVTGYTPGGSLEGITLNGWLPGPNYNQDADVSPTPPAINLNATSTNLSVETDRAYKLD